MTDICLPIDAQNGSPAFPAAQNRVAQAALMLGRGDRPLGAVSGVRPGSAPTITATSTTWTVSPFVAVADPQTGLAVGAYLVAFTAAKTGTVTAADSTLARIDRLDVQVPDDPAGSGALLAPAIVYTVGTPAATPAAPAAPARSFPLATLNVPKAGSGSPSVALTFPFTVASGGILPAANSAAYPANPYQGQIVYDVALDAVLRWNGSNWRMVNGGPYDGTANGTTDANGDATVTHGLGFTPSRVFVMSKINTLGTQAAMPLAVTAITSTTFTVRFLKGTGNGSGQFYVSPAVSSVYSFDWLAVT